MILGISAGMFVVCALAVFTGSTIQASFGFGMGMLAAPFLTVADPAFIPAAILISVLPLSGSVAWLDRHHIDWRGVAFGLIGRVPGVIAGSLVIAVISDEVLAVLVAGSVLLAVGASLTNRRFHRTDGHLVIAGVASGFTGTTTGIGGPPMVLTYQHADPDTMRGTLSTFFVIGSLLSLAALAIAGELGRRQLELTMVILPFVGLGVVTARALRSRIDPAHVRPVVLGLCSLAAVLLLVETFWP